MVREREVQARMRDVRGRKGASTEVVWGGGRIGEWGVGRLRADT